MSGTIPFQSFTRLRPGDAGPEFKSFRTIEVGGQTFVVKLQRRVYADPDVRTIVLVSMPDEFKLLVGGPATDREAEVFSLMRSLGSEHPEVHAAYNRHHRAVIRAARKAIKLTLTPDEACEIGSLRHDHRLGWEQVHGEWNGFQAEYEGEKVSVVVYDAADPLEAETTVEIANGLGEVWEDNDDELLRIAGVIAHAKYSMLADGPTG